MIIREKTWNRQSCTGKLEGIVKELDHHRIDIIKLTGTKTKALEP